MVLDTRIPAYNKKLTLTPGVSDHSPVHFPMHYDPMMNNGLTAPNPAIPNLASFDANYLYFGDGGWGQVVQNVPTSLVLGSECGYHAPQDMILTYVTGAEDSGAGSTVYFYARKTLILSVAPWGGVTAWNFRLGRGDELLCYVTYAIAPLITIGFKWIYDDG